MSADRRHRRTALRPTLALVLALVVLAAVGLGADHLLRTRAEGRLEAELQEALPQVSDDVQVRIGGALFLPQLVTGQVGSAQVSASAVQVDVFTAQDVHLELHGLQLEWPYRADRVQLEATAPASTLQALVRAAGVPDGVEIELRGTDLTAQTRLLGVPLVVVLVPEAQGRSIGISVGAVELGGARIDVSQLPDAIADWLSDIQVELERLPPPLLLDHLEVRPGGVALRVVGQDVILEDL